MLPLITYYGSKWRLCSKIISHFPSHRIYLEPFGGTGIVLFNKAVSELEIYNDLDSDLVNLFNVVKEFPEELYNVLSNTSITEDNFNEALLEDFEDDAISLAAKYFIKSRFSFGGKGESYQGSGSKKYYACKSAIESIFAYAARLERVRITQLPANCLIQETNNNTLIYADPPYHSRERTKIGEYKYDMGRHQHIEFLRTIVACPAMCIISGYDNALYDEYLHDWERVELDARVSFNTSQRVQKEILWLRL